MAASTPTTEDLIRAHLADDAATMGDDALVDLVLDTASTMPCTAEARAARWSAVGDAFARIATHYPSTASIVGHGKIVADGAAAWMVSRGLAHYAESLLALSVNSTVPAWREDVSAMIVDPGPADAGTPPWHRDYEACDALNGVA